MSKLMVGYQHSLLVGPLLKFTEIRCTSGSVGECEALCQVSLRAALHSAAALTLAVLAACFMPTSESFLFQHFKYAPILSSEQQSLLPISAPAMKT